MFTDRVTLEFIAGKGGNGVVAWRREKYIPKGGPNGGDGGQGGSIIFEADEQLFSLEYFRRRRRFKAGNGQQGGSNLKKGRNGETVILKVPLGTLVKDPETGLILHDFVKHKERWEVCTGGKGGRGNYHFRTPTRQAPNICTPGKLGEEKTLELELKLIADIGLVGFPNAGKSTLISALCDVRVKMAPYPFTTLSPNIGCIQNWDYTRTFIADIPGIIKDAHQNRGLGLDFLRHIERTKVLFFVLDASGIDGRSPADDFTILREELKAYDPQLLERPYRIILNKVDQEVSQLFLEEFYVRHHPDRSLVDEISAFAGTGVEALKEKIKSQAL